MGVELGSWCCKCCSSGWPHGSGYSRSCTDGSDGVDTLGWRGGHAGALFQHPRCLLLPAAGWQQDSQAASQWVQCKGFSRRRPGGLRERLPYQQPSAACTASPGQPCVTHVFRRFAALAACCAGSRRGRSTSVTTCTSALPPAKSRCTSRTVWSVAVCSRIRRARGRRRFTCKWAAKRGTGVSKLAGQGSEQWEAGAWSGSPGARACGPRSEQGALAHLY